MRIVRVQVYARERYQGPVGLDTRSVMLEADIESADYVDGELTDLKRKCDEALGSWIAEHRDSRHIPAPTPPPDGELQLAFLSGQLWAVSADLGAAVRVRSKDDLYLVTKAANPAWSLVDAVSADDAISTVKAGGIKDKFILGDEAYTYYSVLPF